MTTLENWTSEPPEEEGWYWVGEFLDLGSEYPRLACDHPCHFQRNKHGLWEYWEPFEMRAVGAAYMQTDEPDYSQWGEYNFYLRSKEPARPPEFK